MPLSTMYAYFESLPIRTQFLLLAIGLGLLFLGVRWNTKNNRKKRMRQHGKDFGKRLQERREEREKEEKDLL